MFDEFFKELVKVFFVESFKQNEKNEKNDVKENSIKGVEKIKENVKMFLIIY